jgi:hypothetical protein
MGCVLYIRCALSIHQKECWKSLGCALYIGARYLPENTVFRMSILPLHVSVLQERHLHWAQRILTKFRHDPLGSLKIRSFSAETCRSKTDILNIWFTLQMHFICLIFIIIWRCMVQAEKKNACCCSLLGKYITMHGPENVRRVKDKQINMGHSINTQRDVFLDILIIPWRLNRAPCSTVCNKTNNTATSMWESWWSFRDWLHPWILVLPSHQ